MTFTASASEQSRVDLVGGKGANLQRLWSWKAPVPEFFIITTEAFDDYKKSGQISQIVEQKIITFLDLHKKIALRSSMIGEDQLSASFAGMFDTVLDVTKENWKESLEQVYASLNSKRVQEYLLKKEINYQFKMAVIAQLQIDVDKSGVLFTRSPVAPTSAIALDAAFGMGEGVVSGHSEVDHLLLTRSGETIKSVRKNERSVLSVTEINDLLKMAIDLEKKMQQPSDIEWGIKDGKMFLFQIRPITQTFKPLETFVDTNLSESYPGSVSPLTAMFVSQAYKTVFTESAILLGAKGKQLEILKNHYGQIISCVDNHLYYNLEHYYAILRALPGGESNIDNWHQMIGGKLDDAVIPYHDTRLNFSNTGRIFIYVLKRFLWRKRDSEKFLESLEMLRSEIESKTTSLNKSSETISYLHNLINQSLGFGLTVVNDIFIMSGLGILTKTLKRKGYNEALVIDLLKTSQEIESLNPLIALESTISALSDSFISALKNLSFESGLNPYSENFAILVAQGWKKEVDKLEEFLNLFGDRSFEELKLESLPLRNNPAQLIHLLTWVKEHPCLKREPQKASSEIKLEIISRKILKFTQNCIATRESTRLWRGKFYHLLRQIIIKMSMQLKQEDQRWNQFSLLDFFSITHLEWKAYAQNDISYEDISKMMTNRSGWMKKKIYPEFIQWVIDEPFPDLTIMQEGVQELSGQGVSPGIIEGIALVLEGPDDAFLSDIKDFILVTKNTDPAWVYIMSRSRGLISEKGSLLSHTAIIGRELAIPTIVGVRHATSKIINGSRIRIDGNLGTIEVI